MTKFGNNLSQTISLGKFISPLIFNRYGESQERNTEKMSSSVSADSTIFLTDTLAQVRKK